MLTKFIEFDLNEIEKNRYILYLDILTLIGYFAYYWFIRMTDLGYSDIFGGDISILLIGVTFFSFPMIICFSLSLEKNIKTQKGLLFSSLQSKSPLLSEFAAIMSAPALVLYLSEVSGMVLILTMIVLMIMPMHLIFIYEGFGGLAGYLPFFIASQIFIAGSLSFIESICLSLKRAPLGVIFIFYLVLQGLALWFVEVISTHSFLLFHDYNRHMHLHITNLYFAMLGFVLFGIAYALFKKHGEV